MFEYAAPTNGDQYIDVLANDTYMVAVLWNNYATLYLAGGG